MPRFLLVRGKPGTLAPNPHILGASPPRFAGMRLRVGASPGPLVTLYEPCEEVLLDSPDLRSAAKAGDLVLIAETVAADHAAARPLLAPPAPAHVPTPAPKVN